MFFDSSHPFENHTPQTRFGSFQRQLNLYGFFRMSRKNNDHGCHYHELFLKGRPDLCRRMARVKSIDSQVKRNRVEPDFSRMRPIVEEMTCTQLLPMTVSSNSTFGAAQSLQQARQWQPSPQPQVEWNHKGNPEQYISLTKALEHSLPHVKSDPSQQILNQNPTHQTKADGSNLHLQSAQNDSLKNAFHKLRPSLQDVSLDVGFSTLKKFQEDAIFSQSHPDLASLRLFKGNTSGSATLDMSDHSAFFPNPPALDSSLSDLLVHSFHQQQDNNVCAMMFEPNLAVQMQQQVLPAPSDPHLTEPSVNFALRYPQDPRVQSFAECGEWSRKIGFPALALQQQRKQQPQPRKGLHQRCSSDTPDIEEEVYRREMANESSANNHENSKFEFQLMPSYTVALQESCYRANSNSVSLYGVQCLHDPTFVCNPSDSTQLRDRGHAR